MPQGNKRFISRAQYCYCLSSFLHPSYSTKNHPMNERMEYAYSKIRVNGRLFSLLLLLFVGNKNPIHCSRSFGNCSARASISFMTYLFSLQLFMRLSHFSCSHFCCCCRCCYRYWVTNYPPDLRTSQRTYEWTEEKQPRQRDRARAREKEKRNESLN